MSQLYILIAIFALGAIAISLVKTGKSKKPKKLSSLSRLAFLFIIAGILFGEKQSLGYLLMAVGGVIAFIDITRKLKA